MGAQWWCADLEQVRTGNFDPGVTWVGASQLAGNDGTLRQEPKLVSLPSLTSSPTDHLVLSRALIRHLGQYSKRVTRLPLDSSPQIDLAYDLQTVPSTRDTFDSRGQQANPISACSDSVRASLYPDRSAAHSRAQNRRARAFILVTSGYVCWFLIAAFVRSQGLLWEYWY